MSSRPIVYRTVRLEQVSDVNRNIAFKALKNHCTLRLMADTSIVSKLYESIGLVSANSVFFFYQLIYVENEPFANLLKLLIIQTSILLLIEGFFTNVSLVIETHYQNMAVMAVWRKRWKDMYL